MCYWKNLFPLMTQTLPTQLFSNLSGKSVQDWCGSGLEVILLLLLMEVLCYWAGTTSHPHNSRGSHLWWPGFGIFRDYSCTVGSAQRLCLAGDTGWRGNKGGRAWIIIIRDQDIVTTISLRTPGENGSVYIITLIQDRKFVFLGLGRE